MEQSESVYQTYLKQIGTQLANKQYQKALDLCDEMKAHLFANPPVNPILLGWQRYYKFLCMLKLRQDKEALDLFLSTEEHPFILDRIQGNLMTTMAAELACALGDVKLTLKLSRMAWSLVFPIQDPVQRIQKAQNACIFFDRLQMNRLNFGFARFLLGFGKSNKMPILVLQGLECLLSNYLQSASLTIAAMLISSEKDVYDLLETPPEGVDRPRVAELMDRMQKLPKQMMISGKFNDALKLLEDNSLSELNDVLKENPLIINENDDNGETLLFKAIEQCNLSAVQMLLKADSDVHRLERENGYIPLLKAVEIGDVKIVEELLNYGSDPEVKDNNGESPLIKAVNEDRFEVLSLLIDYGVIIDRRDGQGFTALMRAAEKGDVQALNRLIYAGADASLKNHAEQTLSEIAAYSENEECIKLCERVQGIFEDIDNAKEEKND